MKKLAPVVLFTFNRPEHTRRTVEALQRNELASESELFVFCDGPRNSDDEPKISELREYIDAIKGFSTVNVIKRETNLGLAQSIINGVSTVVNGYGSAIILEDDLITSPYFLRYMNDGLQVYADNDKVASIVGWVPHLDIANPPSTFFLKGTDCWGWATWSRAWCKFEPDANKLVKSIRNQNLEYEFNCDGSINSLGILEDFIGGGCSTWALRWEASIFLADMYSLFPGRSLVDNIGFDGTGRHCGVGNDYSVSIAGAPVDVIDMPVIVNNEMRLAINSFLKKLHTEKDSNILRKILSSTQKNGHNIYTRLVNYVHNNESQS